MPVKRSEVLRLYKNLLLYSKSLIYTDPVYFKRRICAEFRQNKDLTNFEDINFAFKNYTSVCIHLMVGEVQSSSMESTITSPGAVTVDPTVSALFAGNWSSDTETKMLNASHLTAFSNQRGGTSTGRDRYSSYHS